MSAGKWIIALVVANLVGYVFGYIDGLRARRWRL